MTVTLTDLMAEMAALPGAMTDPDFRAVQAHASGPAHIWCEAELSPVLAHRWTVVPLANDADVHVSTCGVGDPAGIPAATAVRVVTTGGTLGGGRLDAVDVARSIVARHGGADAVVVDLTAARAALHHGDLVRMLDARSMSSGALDVRDQVDDRTRSVLGVFGLRVVVSAHHDGRDPVDALLLASGVEDLHDAIETAAVVSVRRNRRIAGHARAWLARRSDPASIRLCARLDSGRQLEP
jgi:hypothetical protein